MHSSMSERREGVQMPHGAFQPTCPGVDRRPRRSESVVRTQCVCAGGHRGSQRVSLGRTCYPTCNEKNVMEKALPLY